ncbi:MAG: type 2 isopentenyl-diphosphate Delta-isomerase [Deltaproteobacteria bacterium]|nr:type 2 isopentenyl-diphosphate Delta-isomerase [Deltaproteobacteria bacterium]
MTRPAPPSRDPRSKVAHIDACLSGDVEYRKSAGFDRYELVHQALPELALDQIDLSFTLLDKQIGAPLMVAPMTGGVDRGLDICRRLAAAAERFGLPMALGSLRLAIEDPERAKFFQVRDVAPSILLFANVGAGQLRTGWGVEQCLAAVELVKADHLLIHVNPIQEAVQGGDVDFTGMIERIRTIAEALAEKGITVGVREVGFGLSASVAGRLVDAGISLLDCGGAGGTSWARVEGLCADNDRARRLGDTFGEWGIPTAESIRAIRGVSHEVYIIASGGLRTGLDVAKALALGADLAAMARPLLLAADRGGDALEEFIGTVLAELRIAMFGIGAANVDQLKATPHLVDRRAVV